MAPIVCLFGLVTGSFLNVCIRRIPQGVSIVKPASRCPKCQTPIKPYDNIPVLSYLALGGKCRACRAPISAVYPAVELLTGLLFLACYLAFGLTLIGAKWAVFSGLMIVLVFTDIFERVLPDGVNFFGLGVGLAWSFLAAANELPNDGSAMWISQRLFAFPPPVPALSFADALLGAGIGAGLLWLVGEGYFRLRGREGMGLGDVKMMAMVGAFLGPKRTLLTILGGSLLGSVLGLLFILAWRKGSEYELPFGTFLGAAALLVLFYGTPALNWYQSFFVGP
jgi:leader peptidase (prepilin peptidase)/N-methyltransferase